MGNNISCIVASNKQFIAPESSFMLSCRMNGDVGVDVSVSAVAVDVSVSDVDEGTQNG